MCCGVFVPQSVHRAEPRRRRAAQSVAASQRRSGRGKYLVNRYSPKWSAEVGKRASPICRRKHLAKVFKAERLHQVLRRVLASYTGGG
jgi:hypothetical protein